VPDLGHGATGKVVNKDASLAKIASLRLGLNLRKVLVRPSAHGGDCIIISHTVNTSPQMLEGGIVTLT